MNYRETLDAIGREIGYGRAQQILGELWEARHDCAPRGRMGVTVHDGIGAELHPIVKQKIAAGHCICAPRGLSDDPRCPIHGAGVKGHDHG